MCGSRRYSLMTWHGKLGCLLSSINTRFLMQYLEFLGRTTNSSVFYQSALRSIKNPASKDIPWTYYCLADRPTQRKSALHDISCHSERNAETSYHPNSKKPSQNHHSLMLNFYSVKSWNQRQHASRNFPHSDDGLLRIPSLESGGFRSSTVERLQRSVSH